MKHGRFSAVIHAGLFVATRPIAFLPRGETALRLAMSRRNVEIVDFLVNHADIRLEQGGCQISSQFTFFTARRKHLFNRCYRCKAVCILREYGIGRRMRKNPTKNVGLDGKFRVRNRAQQRARHYILFSNLCSRLLKDSGTVIFFQV